MNVASTEDNANLRRYLSENVFLVKQAPGEDHWLAKLPAQIVAILEG